MLSHKFLDGFIENLKEKNKLVELLEDIEYYTNPKKVITRLACSDRLTKLLKVLGIRRWIKIDTLDISWVDKVEVLLHVNFQVLVDFMEKETPDKYVDWDFDEYHSNAWKEMNELYEWWTVIRPNRFDPLLHDKTIEHPPFLFEDVPERPGYSRLVHHDPDDYPEYEQAMEDSRRLSVEWEEEDQRNLHRLIDIRMFLWT